MKDTEFMESFIALCREHGVVDFALVIRDIDGETMPAWFAGADLSKADENQVANRERAALLHYELSGLAQDIVRKTWFPSQTGA